MTWALLAEFAIKYGLPAAEKLLEKWLSGAPPTAAEFAELRAMAQQSAVERMKAALVTAGIPLDSPQAQALIAAAGGA